MPHLALPADVAKALESWIGTLPEPRPSLEQATMMALRDWLMGLGLLPFHDTPDDAN